MAPMKRPAAWGCHGHYQGTWSLREAARRLTVTEKELRKLLVMGQLDFVQIAGQIRIPIEHIRQRLKKPGWPGSAVRRVRPR